MATMARISNRINILWQKSWRIRKKCLTRIFGPSGPRSDNSQISCE
ncbi:hypothetical protein [Escherichia phage BI-EHEC]|nr:hypothetical protein [Escherichia phage BI-EHEC]